MREARGIRSFGYLIVLSSVIAACGARSDGKAAAERSASKLVLDGAHGGTAGFFFLPPLAGNAPPGTLVGGLAPIVSIEERAPGTRGVIATFTMASGVTQSDSHYMINWDTSTAGLDPAFTYRIHVFVQGVELGRVDVDVVASGSGLKNVDTNDFVGLVNGRTLPIKFRIEKAALNLQKIAAGGAHSLWLKPDGSLWAWGDNSVGQFGDGTTISHSAPVQVGSGYVSIAAGWRHTVGLKADGSVWAWGDNTWGQLGDGTTTQRNYPVQVGSGFVSIVTGAYHTMALKTDGTVWAWGLNAFGQLGDGTPWPAYQNTYRTVPGQVLGGEYESISSGQFNSFAMKTDGTLWAWGQGFYGMLGDGIDGRGHSAPVQVVDRFESITSGLFHTLALKTDGTVWAWGQHFAGCLGDGVTTSSSAQVLPEQILEGGFSVISAGYYDSFAVRDDGTLWAWGYDVGTLGDGSQYDGSQFLNQPIPVLIGDGFVSVATGTQLHTLGLKLDGSLWSWGNNGSGQVGIGAVGGTRNTPTLVQQE
jgi:alpha-tubulin suppressor-like RCC1 family protein